MKVIDYDKTPFNLENDKGDLQIILIRSKSTKLNFFSHKSVYCNNKIYGKALLIKTFFTREAAV